MKKILSFILAFVLLSTPLCVETYASDGELTYETPVMPRYTYIDSVSAGISEAALGFVICLSYCTSFQADKTFVLTCNLQRTDGTHAWETYKSKTETFSGKGIFTIEKTWFAPATHDYRVLTVLSVENSSGVVVETTTKASAVLYK